MYSRYLVSGESVAIISAFALAWFIVGLLIGQRLPFGSRRSRSARPQRHRSKKRVEIYVGNLSYDVRDRDLRKAFEPFGKVLSARIIANKFNGKSKGFGFVEMENRTDSLAAIRALNGKEFRGRKTVVNEAKSRPRD